MKTSNVIIPMFIFLALVDSLSAPERITSLAATNITGNSVGFSWLVPNEAISNDVRLSTRAINTLNWNSNERLDYLNTSGTPGTIQLVTVTDLSPNTTYFVAVKTQGTNGWSTMSNPARATTGGGEATVSLAWNPSPDFGITNYNVYVGTTSVTYQEVAVTPAISGLYGDWSGAYDVATNAVGNVTYYTVTGLTWGVTYYFAVTASDADGYESDYCNEVAWTPGQ